MTSETNALGTIDATTALLQAELPRLEQHQQALEKELATVNERLESMRTALTALRALSSAPVPSSNTEAQDVKAEADAEAEAESVVAPRIPRQAQESVDSAVEAAAPQEQAAAPQEQAAAAPARRAARKASVPKGRKQASAKPKTERGQAKKAVAAKSAEPAKKAVAAKGAKSAATAKPAKAKAPKKTATAAPAVDDSGSLTEMAMKVLSGFGDTPVRAREVTEALGRELTPNSINTVRSTLDRLVATSRAHRAGRGLYQAPAN
ncbi:hypothetical protein AB0N06_17665 [Streptomyces sp. NPDC051020]|uniref:hypothetical protein n=1 Tax=Streptomyces sp. NPDC051020 TaxID=3155409 RepID=UPI00343EB858